MSGLYVTCAAHVQRLRLEQVEVVMVAEMTKIIDSVVDLQ